VIIVTGASRGLGRAICERLVSSGTEVFGIARHISEINIPATTCDVSDYEEVKTVTKYLRREKKQVCGLINAAGVASMNLAITTPSDVSEQIVKTNLLGTIYCCQLIAPLIIRNRGGVIINFSTIAVALGLKGESVYAASKAGIEGFTRSFAREVADFNINVNCIAPGPIETDLLKGVTNNQIEEIISQQIINKQYTPDTVCDLVEVLLDKKSESLSGQIFHVGGV